jgi:F420H(2)-dependent quinone reductase
MRRTVRHAMLIALLLLALVAVPAMAGKGGTFANPHFVNTSLSFYPSTNTVTSAGMLAGLGNGYVSEQVEIGMFLEGTYRCTTTVGRRSGKERSVILGYYEDGPNLVTLAMNGWGEGHPAWWLNLREHPEVEVVLVEGRRPVRARAAEGEERARLWAGWRQLEPRLDGYAARRSTPTPVVVLEPREESGGQR